MRICGPVDGSRVPEDKSKTHEFHVDLVLRRCGNQQNFVDVSRCPLLSASFLNRTVPSLCCNLLYLDVSYSACNDLSGIYKFCPTLKALNLAGLKLLEPHLEGIEALGELEALCLRNTNIEDISALSMLPVLRTLDLGFTQINRIDNALKDKERLEELLLDGCYTEFTEQIISAMGKMKRLKLVNLHEGVFAMKRSAIARTMEFPMLYEPYPRRVMFFDAVVRNDYKAVFRFLSAGQDVNVRVQPREQNFFKQIFLSRCIFTKTSLRTPYFLLHEKSSEEFRPNVLHLAIFFNCLETVKILLEANIDTTAQVEVVDVMDDPDDCDALIEDTNPVKTASVGLNKTLNAMVNSSSKKHRARSTLSSGATAAVATTTDGEPTASSAGDAAEREGLESATNTTAATALRPAQRHFTPTELVHFLFEKNVHRLTANLAEQKILNWKTVCEAFRDRLLFVLEPSLRTPKQSDAMEWMAFDEYMYRAFFPVEMETVQSKRDKANDTTADATKELAKIMHLKLLDEHHDGEETHKHNKHTEHPPNSTTNKPAAVKHDDDLNSDNFEAETVVKNFHNPFHNAPKYGRSSLLNGEDEDEEEDELHRQERLANEARKRPLMLPKKPRLVEWREHGLVCKLVGTPTHHVVPRDPIAADNWMTLSSVTATNTATVATVAEEEEEDTESSSAMVSGNASTRIASSPFSSRPSSRAAAFSLSRKPSMRGPPTFAPLERLRAMSIRGLTLLSDPDDKPFSRMLPPRAQSPNKKTSSTSSAAFFEGTNTSPGKGKSRKITFAGESSATNDAPPSSSSTVEISVLGKKSYFLDSKRLAIEDKLRMMEEAFKKQKEIEGNRVYRDGRVRRKLKKRETMDQRRQMFMEYLQKRIESKYDELDK